MCCCWKTLLFFLSECVCAVMSHNHVLCPQWDIWRAPASEVLPECWDAVEWIVHMSVWPWLLLEHPLIRVLRRHPGKDTTP